MIYWSGFILGLLGSLHCAGMCGPLALALPCPGGGRTGAIAGRAAYHLGRILTYCLMGLLFGSLGRSLRLAGIQQSASIALGIALLIGLLASRRLKLWRPVTSLVASLKSSMSLCLRRPSALSLGMLGLLNGFLPCGLVYVAAAGAAATGDTMTGVGYMTAFGVGTVPMLTAISLSGKLLPPTLRLKLVKLVPVSVLLLAALLILRGLSLGIPYLSPNLAATHSCCQP
jgi:sulfite exporter TauE/SafE